MKSECVPIVVKAFKHALRPDLGPYLDLDLDLDLGPYLDLDAGRWT